MPGGSWWQEGDAVNTCRWLLFVHFVTQIVPLGICWVKALLSWALGCLGRGSATPPPTILLIPMPALVLDHQDPLREAQPLPSCPSASYIYLLSVIKDPVPLQLFGAFFGSGSPSGGMTMHRGVLDGFWLVWGEPVYTPDGDKLQRALGCLGLVLGQGDMPCPALMGFSGRLCVSSSCRVPALQLQEGERTDVPWALPTLCQAEPHRTAQEMTARAGVPVVCLRKTILTSTIMKLLVINKRRILLPSVLGTQRTDLHRIEGVPSPHQQPFSRLCQAQPPPESPPQLPGSKYPQSSQHPYPWLPGELCASGWGTTGAFISDCCELAHGQVGPGQENELVRAAQSSPAKPGSLCEDGACAAGDVAKGTASPSCCKAHTSQGCTAPHPPPHCP